MAGARSRNSVLTGSTKLSDVDLNTPLGGSQGLSVNDISRIRVHYLLSQHTAIVQQIQFADAKAAALVTLIGLIALRGPIDMPGPAMNPISIVFSILCAVCIILCMLTVFPRYPGKSGSSELAEMENWSWPSHSSGKSGAKDYSLFMQTSEVSQLVHSLSVSNLSVARVLRKKFRFLRMGFAIAALALIVLGLRLATVM